MTNCGSCKARVIWGVSLTTGKRMPIDAQVNKQGNVYLVDDADTFVVLSGSELDKARDRGSDLRLSHFVTCPQAQSWRQR